MTRIKYLMISKKTKYSKSLNNYNKNFNLIKKRLIKWKKTMRRIFSISKNGKSRRI